MPSGLGFLQIASEFWTIAVGLFALMVSSGSAYLIARLKYRPDGKRAETERMVALREQDRLDFDAIQKGQPVGAIHLSLEFRMRQPPLEPPKRMILIIKILPTRGESDRIWQVRDRQPLDQVVPVLQPCAETKVA